MAAPAPVRVAQANAAGRCAVFEESPETPPGPLPLGVADVLGYWVFGAVVVGAGTSGPSCCAAAGAAGAGGGGFGASARNSISAALMVLS